MTQVELIQACIDVCLTCLRDCEKFLQVCRLDPERDQNLYQTSVRACRDCLDILNLCASLLLRKDLLASQVCAVSADLCFRCSNTCKQHSFDIYAQKCAYSCRKCARLCQDLALNGQAR